MEIRIHEMIPDHRQDALMRFDGLLDELLKQHEYPEDVREVVTARLGEWEKSWINRGVRRGGTFSDHAYRELPMVVKAQMMEPQNPTSRGGELLPPGRKASS